MAQGSMLLQEESQVQRTEVVEGFLMEHIQ